MLAASVMKRCMGDCAVAVFAGVVATISCVYTFFVVNSFMMYLGKNLKVELETNFRNQFGINVQFTKNSIID
jgi:hypothetical protein